MPNIVYTLIAMVVVYVAVKLTAQWKLGRERRRARPIKQAELDALQGSLDAARLPVVRVT